MFKWLCFGLGVVFVAVSLWILNDIRLTVRSTAWQIHSAGTMVSESLPPIVAKTRESADVIAENLPEVVGRTRMTTEVLAELAKDIRQLKDLAGGSANPRDKNLVAYTDGMLKAVELAGGVVGVSKTIGRGLKNTVPVKEWASGARKEALVLMLLVRSKKEMAARLATTNLGFNWWIEPPGRAPERLIDWLKANHPETRELDW
ncbi:MAG: hypothetical protein ACRC33_05200 [Gemmataceae bacterium]